MSCVVTPITAFQYVYPEIHILTSLYFVLPCTPLDSSTSSPFDKLRVSGVYPFISKTIRSSRALSREARRRTAYRFTLILPVHPEPVEGHPIDSLYACRLILSLVIHPELVSKDRRTDPTNSTSSGDFNVTDSSTLENSTNNSPF